MEGPENQPERVLKLLYRTARLNDIIMHSVGKEETRKVGFTITYRFRTEKKMKNQSAAETEMSRLNMDNQ